MDDIEKQTGRKIPANQRKALLNELSKDSHSTKLEGANYSNHRKKFNNEKDELIKEWERQTGQVWPTYLNNVLSKKGTAYIKAGSNYDAHEIIPNKHNSPLKWWNLHPAANGSEHQGGIHRSGSPFYDNF